MEAFLASLSLVALAEMGDKTQLLAILLAARLRKPVPIIAGIFAATLANHFLAALGFTAGQSPAWSQNRRQRCLAQTGGRHESRNHSDQLD